MTMQRKRLVYPSRIDAKRHDKLRNKKRLFLSFGDVSVDVFIISYICTIAVSVWAQQSKCDAPNVERSNINWQHLFESINEQHFNAFASLRHKKQPIFIAYELRFMMLDTRNDSVANRRNKKIIAGIDNINMQLSNRARHISSGQQHLAQIR